MSRLTSGRTRGDWPVTVDHGQATVEFALLLPLFVIMVVALFDVMALARDQLLVDVLARDAARRASQAVTLDEARESVAVIVGQSGRSDAHWHLAIDDDTLTVGVSLEPRTSLTSSSLRWLGANRRIEGRASFVTEYDFSDK